MFTVILSAIGTFFKPFFTWAGGVFTRHKVAIILAVVCGILIGILDFEVHQKQKEIDKYQLANQNLLAANDSIRVTYAKDKQVEYNKYADIAKQASDLKGVNDDLLKQIKNTKGDVKAAVSATTVVTDSGKLVATPVTDSTTKDSLGNYHIDKDVRLSYVKYYSKGNFHNLTTLIHVEGVPDSLIIGGDLVTDQVSVNLFTGIKKNKDGNYEIFVRSDYPGLTVSDLNGALIDKKIFEQEDKKRIFTLGVGLGYVPFLYNFGTHTTEVFPSKIGATIGVNVNISEIFRKK